jgi:hypothetical protein
MTIDELLALRRQEAHRLSESAPSSPELDAAMSALEDLDSALRAWESQQAGPGIPSERSTGSRLDRENR